MTRGLWLTAQQTATCATTDKGQPSGIPVVDMIGEPKPPRKTGRRWQESRKSNQACSDGLWDLKDVQEENRSGSLGSWLKHLMMSIENPASVLRSRRLRSTRHSRDKDKSRTDLPGMEPLTPSGSHVAQCWRMALATPEAHIRYKLAKTLMGRPWCMPSGQATLAMVATDARPRCFGHPKMPHK